MSLTRELPVVRHPDGVNFRSLAPDLRGRI